MKKNTNILCSVALAFFMHVQSVEAQTALISDIVDPAQQNNSLLYESNGKFMGSRFLFEEFQVGSIEMLTGVTFDKILIRYNAFDDLIHFKKLDSEKENIVKSSLIAGFSFYVPQDQILYKFVKIKDSFYHQIAEGEGFKILKKHGKKLVKGASPNGYNSGGNDTLDRLIDTDSYFLYDVEDIRLTQFSTKKGDVYDFLISKELYDDSKAIKQFVAKNNIDIKSDSGLRRLIDKDKSTE